MAARQRVRNVRIAVQLKRKETKMNSRTWIVIGAAALGIAAGGSTLASGQTAGTHRAATAIALVEKGGGVKFVDSALPHARHPYEFSAGDLAIVRRDLYTPANAHAGELRIACVAITATRQQCDGTLTLSDGTLEVAGLSQPSPTTTVAVTGGTGAYAGVTGSSSAKDRAGNGDVADMTITLNGVAR